MENKILNLIVMAVLFPVAAVKADEQAVTANIYLITHSELQIDAKPVEIWPYILDMSEWKTLATKTHYRGQPDQVGEIEVVRGEADGAPYQFYLETIELIKEKRRVIAIFFDEPAKGDISYAAWTLFPDESGTLVTYDVYSVSRVAGVPPEQVSILRGQANEPNQLRFDEELHVLKQLVEK